MSVEIIGRAVRAPSAQNVDELFQLLKDGRCVVGTVPEERWSHARYWHPVPGTPGKAYTFAGGVIDDLYDFDPAVFGLTAREAMYMDPQQRLLLELVWRALEDAALAVPTLQGERVGVYVGASSLDTGNTYMEDPAAGGPYFMTGNTLSVIANRISHIFGLNGPSLTIDTACSSSLVALDQAVRALRSGEIDTAIVGGVNVLAHPFSYIGFSQARMLSPEGLCRAYGENGEGYVRAEGGGVVILRTTSRAVANRDRSYATILATGLNSAGRTNGISLPSREMQASLLRDVYQSNGLDPDDLAFIEGHGTGTRVGDPAELWAIGTELGQKRRQELLVGSIKSNVGHSEPASGMFGLIKSMLSLQHDFLPASLHADRLSSEIDFDALHVKVNRQGLALPRSKQRRLVGINSFGFGGTNAHVVIADPPETVDVGSAASGPFMVSAHTQSALKRLLESYSHELASGRPDVDQLLKASAPNRTHQKYRFAIDSALPDVVRKGIDAHLSGSPSVGREGEAPAGETRAAFVFAGNGSQWAGMAMGSYRHNPQFTARFTEICTAFRSWLNLDLLAIFEGPDLQTHLSDTRVGQALLFAIQASLADALFSKNIKPSVVFGHSVGEIAAAYCARILTLEEAVAIVAIRSRHQHALAGEGKMAAVALSAQNAMELAEKSGLRGIELAAVNTHSSVTVSGPVEEINAYREAARQLHIPVHILDIDYAFHHSSIDREQAAFIAELPSFTPRSGDITFVSSVTGQVLNGEALDGRYWWSNVREVVRFSEATAAAIVQGCNLFVEIAPRSILASYLVENSKQSGPAISVLPTLKRPAHETDPVPLIVAAAVANGMSPWSSEQAATRNAGVSLPPLPFERETLRPPETSDRIDLFGRGQNAEDYTLLGWRTDPKSASWKNHIDANLFPDLAEHVVDGKAILPGSAFIEIAIAAAHQLYRQAEVELSNLEILRPLELSTQRLSELSTVISAETGQIEIRSREYLSEDDWSIHAVGRIRKAVKRLPMDVFTEGVRASASEIPLEAAYETARRFGLEYGPSFQLLRDVTSRDNRVVTVDLLSAAKPAHPYLTYRLNPIFVDAAFHGLVALFGELTGDADGAPYIPVRFGSVRCRTNSENIRFARIEILRFSAFSLKIRVELFDEAGVLVAALDDCRFRRTFLKLHHSLDTVAFHYEKIPAGSRGLDRRLLPEILPSYASVDPDPEALLYDAAIYRASYDIASAACRAFGGSVLAGQPELSAFVANCFVTCEDYGLAQSVSGKWTVSAECDLPAFDEIIRELLREYPAGSAAAILINQNRRSVLNSIDAMSGENIPPESTDGVSEATLDHFRNGLDIARERVDEATRLVDAFLTAAQTFGSVIVETGAVSVAVSTSLAEIAERHEARLFILEEDENLRSTLATAFSRNPFVSVIDGKKIVLPEHVDLAVSASGLFCARLKTSEFLQSNFENIAATGAELLLIENRNRSLADFIYGLQEGWFDQTVMSEFPVGKMPSADDILDTVRLAGFADAHHAAVDLAQGSLAVVTAKGSKKTQSQTSDAADRQLVAVLCDDAGLDAVQRRSTFQFDTTSGAKADELENVLKSSGSRPLDIVYVLGKEPSPRFHSACVANHLDALGRLAEALRSRVGDEECARSRLFIIAPGGSSVADPAASPVAAAVWSFSRVLQNEYDELDVVLADISREQLSHAIWTELLRLQSQGENELYYGTSSTQFEVLRMVPGPFRRSDEFVVDYQSAAIVQKSPGRIETIGWQRQALPQPKADEIVVSVAATGLNFRDVMWSMGMLPEEALEDGFAGATIGMEFSGTVLSVGGDVAHLQAGDRVMGIGPGAFSTHVVVTADGVTRIPDGMTLMEAATVPVTFLTAFYALVELGRLRPGETVLIHGAAGGVGLAALQIAKLKGASVIATAGTAEKRNLVTTLGADHVFDSRSLDFFNDVMDVTDGEGVDVVLNSLFQEAMERSLELVKPFGRFLELGKRDYYSDSKIGLRPFRKNISYFGIDADQLLVEAPDTAKRIFEDIARLFGENALKPLPYRSFGYHEISPAFRLMQSAGHIGKIIVTPPQAGHDTVQRATLKTLQLSGGVYLIVGGIGGFGLEAANWIAAKGASHLALATRSGVLDSATRDAIEGWKRKSISASVHACDVTSEPQLSALLAQLRDVGPLRGVVHAAMVLDDALIANLTPERNRPVIHTKVEGARLLDELTEQDELELFLLFSSATTMVGNPGQGNYVAANGYLEGLATARRQRGKTALAVGFGAIADTGFLARNTDVNDILSKRIGNSAMKARDALRHVEDYLVSQPAGSKTGSVVIAEINWQAASSLPIVKKPVFSAIGSSQIAQQAAAGSQLDLYLMIDGKSSDEIDTLLHSLIAGELSSILQMAENNITREKVLRDIGLDSLMAMELGTSFQQKTGVDLPLSAISDGTTVGDIVTKLREKLHSRHSLDGAQGEVEALLSGLTTKHIDPKLLAKAS